MARRTMSEAVRESSSCWTIGAFPTEIASVDELLFCVGRNVRRQAWVDLEFGEFESAMNTNLNAVVYRVSHVLPAMFRRTVGRIVVISSWAGWSYGRDAGVAYSAGTTALKSLTESRNDQHGPDGISASLTSPGDIDTPLIDNRPVVPTREQRDRMLTAEDAARPVRLA